MENTIISDFNIEDIGPTNQDVTIVFTPDSNVMRYTYSVLKDGIIVKNRTIDNGEISRITLDETGDYKIVVDTYDFYNKKTTMQSGEYKIDKEAPVITLENEVVKIMAGETLSVMDGIIVQDNQDGDLSNKVTTNIDELNLEELGVKKLIYTVSDQAGNVATETMIVNVVKNDAFAVMVLQLSAILIFISSLVIWLIYKRTLKLEKRIGKYTLEPIDANAISVMDYQKIWYEKILKKISNNLNSSVFLQKYSLRYDKYIGIINSKTWEPMDFISEKVVSAIIFILIAIFSFVIQVRSIHFYDIVLIFLIGFFVPDILYFSKFRFHRRKIENDLLQAIIIMNNAFKSGRSIAQAIDLVAQELDGAIKREFEKMRMELSFGLAIEVVFARFAERVKIEEVNYLTASLTILNKTGGNIIKVFSSIEQSLFSKKKLRLELESLTGSSKLIMYVLFCVPILFVVFVSAVNPTYFSPFFTSTLGLVLLFMIIMFYIIYIICVNKIMKVRI